MVVVVSAADAGWRMYAITARAVAARERMIVVNGKGG